MSLSSGPPSGGAPRPDWGRRLDCFLGFGTAVVLATPSSSSSMSDRRSSILVISSSSSPTSSLTSSPTSAIFGEEGTTPAARFVDCLRLPRASLTIRMDKSPRQPFKRLPRLEVSWRPHLGLGTCRAHPRTCSCVKCFQKLSEPMTM